MLFTTNIRGILPSTRRRLYYLYTKNSNSNRIDCKSFKETIQNLIGNSFHCIGEQNAPVTLNCKGSQWSIENQIHSICLQHLQRTKNTGALLWETAVPYGESKLSLIPLKRALLS